MTSQALSRVPVKPLYNTSIKILISPNKLYMLFYAECSIDTLKEMRILHNMLIKTAFVCLL